MKWLWTLLAGLSISLVSPAVVSVMAGEKDQDQKQEESEGEKIALNQCPPAVQKTIQDEAQGGQIEEIEKEAKGNATIYEAEIVKDGQKIEIKVDDSGKLLKRKVKKEKKEKDESEKKP
jgi:uncharacterized membrane protein YkoI